VVLGLVVGKPLGVTLAAFAAVKARIAVMPEDTPLRAFFGAALLCGVSDPVALLMADQAFPHSDLAAVAKIGVLVGSAIAAVLGAAVIATSPAPVTPVPDPARVRVSAAEEQPA
jgi:NhaA family Na+:H+ antiporter